MLNMPHPGSFLPKYRPNGLRPCETMCLQLDEMEEAQLLINTLSISNVDEKCQRTLMI